MPETKSQQPGGNNNIFVVKVDHWIVQLKFMIIEEILILDPSATITFKGSICSIMVPYFLVIWTSS